MSLSVVSGSYLSRQDEADDVIRAAQDLMSLWNAQKIAGLPRAERNAAIEGARERLFVLGSAYTAKYF